MVIDNSSAFRMDPDVPLVVPEVNEADLERHKGIVANPNCVAAPLVVRAEADRRRGRPGARDRVELPVGLRHRRGGGRGAARRRPPGTWPATSPSPSVYPHPIAFNVLPHIDVFDESGYTGEERKVRAETRKMLGMPDLAVSATCVRVPVFYAHSQAVHIETTDKLTADAARDLLIAAPGVVLVDEPAANRYPLARDAAGRDDVLVGRIREDSSHPRGLAFWLVVGQPAQGRRHQRRPDRGVAGHQRVAAPLGSGPDRLSAART